MRASRRASVWVCLLGLITVQACVPFGHRSAPSTGACARSKEEHDALAVTARFLADTSGGSNWAPGSRRTWPFLGAAPSEIHVVDDDQVCRRVLDALRSVYGVKANSIAVAKVRRGYIAFVVPRENATYVLDSELRALD